MPEICNKYKRILDDLTQHIETCQICKGEIDRILGVIKQSQPIDKIVPQTDTDDDKPAWGRRE